MKVFDESLKNLRAFQEADEILRKGKGPAALTGCVESQKAQMLSKAGQSGTRLVVSYDERTARSLMEDIHFFSGKVCYFPEKDMLFYKADIKNNALVRERISVYRKLIEQEECTIVTTFSALMNTLVPISVFKDQLVVLGEGQTVEQEALVYRLVSLGYEHVAKVENPGEFTVHGSIMDIYDLTEEVPFRIDFWDDEIDTIRLFSPETQISGERREEVTIYPAGEMFLDRQYIEDGKKRLEKEYRANRDVFMKEDNLEAAAALQSIYREVESDLKEKYFAGILENFLPLFYEKTSTLLDYLPKDTVIGLDEPVRLFEQGSLTETEFGESYRERLKKGLALPSELKILRSVKETFAALETGHTLIVSGLSQKLPMIGVKSFFSVDVRSMVSYKGNFAGLLTELKRYQKLKYRVVLLCPSRTRASRMAEEFREMDIHAYYSDDPEEMPKEGTLLIMHGSIHKGFMYPIQKFLVLTESDIYGTEKKKKKRKKAAYDGQKLKSFSELSVGDYVVHENYGIGIYGGVVSIETDGIVRDYLKISYRNSGTLYIPVTNLDVVQKYAGKDAHPPKINRLDSPDWGKTKSRVKAAVEEVADDLVELYAARQAGKGFMYGPDTVWQQEFEEMFPYEETEDQLDAIRDTKQDMEQGKIMDRLICGDVGFGKTEIALRAAFKAVQEGKQVAYLVPTTILAEQHYTTFQDRMSSFPVKVGLLSRFRTAGEAKKLINDLKKGSVDIVIGTHRLLSKDVGFKDLGLLIIDEEQRFGVRHKEEIKKLKMNVNVLTMTATPIPRTLHMGMIGVRDMSVLTDPPEERLPIQTYVMEYSPELVREAINRELSRNGQVYYIYNRTADIEEVASKIQAMCPDAVVSYAHGKMNERELEERMLSFIEGETDVLVSTTIVETGLDIPNTNTIIVHDAERYGLAQLYQLRGRVGRSNRQAYAFIMYQKDKVVKEDAAKRLEAIRQFTDLGSGMQIAMQDLEIRGAGAILGEAQSGHMSEVGYELYCKMLSEAVRRKKGEERPAEDLDTLLDIKVDAYIPGFYIANEVLKLEIYKRISFIETEEDKEALTDELTDRYGDIPRQVENLMEVARLKALAKSIYFTEIKGNQMELKFRFSPDARIKVEKLPELFESMKGAMRFVPGNPPGLHWHQMNIAEGSKTPVTVVLNQLLTSIKELLI